MTHALRRVRLVAIMVSPAATARSSRPVATSSHPIHSSSPMTSKAGTARLGERTVLALDVPALGADPATWVS